MDRRCHSFLLVAVLALLALATSCADDGHYSTSPSLRLTFDADTVAFDTLVAGIGSATAVLTVRNDAADHLLLTQVALAGGSTSPFRVNVDGQYGTTFSDVEVRAGDSLYVFVEVTPPCSDADVPLPCCDSLLFTLASGVQQRVVLTAWALDAVVLRGTVITDDVTFSSRRPYLIYDSLVVEPTATLTLSPGTKLLFHRHASLVARGALRAVGTPDSLVTLRGDRLDRMFSYLPYDRLSAQWGGVTLHPADGGHRLDYCDIHGGDYGIRAVGTADAPLLLTMQGTQVHNVAGHGLHAVLCHGSAVNCLFTNAGGHCVSILGGAMSFLHCTIANFYPAANVFPRTEDDGVGVSICNVHTQDDDGHTVTVLYPLTGTEFVNCLITGSGDDEVTGTVTEGNDSLDLRDAARYAFRHSLVHSSDTANPHFTHIRWENPDSIGYGRQHFRHINADNRSFCYDFHLDSLSCARGMGDASALPVAPYDRDGVQRTTPPDVGCYQYRP